MMVLIIAMSFVDASCLFSRPQVSSARAGHLMWSDHWLECQGLLPGRLIVRKL